MAGHDEEKREPNDASRALRLAAVREALERDTVDADATETLIALRDAVDSYQRRTPAGLRNR